MEPPDYIMPEVVTPAGLAFERHDLAWRNARVAFFTAALLHGGFVALFAFDDWRGASGAPTAQTEISVDLVDENDVPGDKSADKGRKSGGKGENADAAGEKSGNEGGGDKSPQDGSGKKVDETGSKATEKSPDASPASRPATRPANPEQTARTDPTAKPLEVPKPPPGGPVEPPPAPAQGGSPANSDAKQPEQSSVGAGGQQPLPRLPTFAMPGLIGATRGPSAGSAASEEFKGVVYGMLERVKRFPDTARARQAAGTVVVTFDIDDAGNPQSIHLARTSGQADLDREALDMVQRAAPYPQPTRGVARSFAPAITFGLN
jgi:periplasmic protein TonB